MRWTSPPLSLPTVRFATLALILFTLLCVAAPIGAATPALERLAWHPREGRLAVITPSGIAIFARQVGRFTRAQHLNSLTPITAMAWSPDGRQLAVGRATGTLALLDAVSGRTVWDVSALSGAVQAVAWGAGIISVAGRSDSAVHLFAAHSGHSAGVLPMRGPVFSLTFGPDGSALAISGAVQGTYEMGYLEVWDVRSQSRRYAYPADMRAATRLAWQPHAPDQVGVLTNFDMFIWAAGNGETRPVDMLLSDGRNATTFAWSPDGVAFVGVTNGKGGGLLFVRRNEREIGRFSLRGAVIESVSWDATGKVIAVLESAGQLHFLDGHSAKPLAAAIRVGGQ